MEKKNFLSAFIRVHLRYLRQKKKTGAARNCFGNRDWLRYHKTAASDKRGGHVVPVQVRPQSVDKKRECKAFFQRPQNPRQRRLLPRPCLQSPLSADFAQRR